MKAYKGFTKRTDGTLWCRDFQYEVGKVNRYEGHIEPLESGLHVHSELHKTWYFYPNNGNNIFYEVECSGKIIKSKNVHGLAVCSEITLLREIDMANITKFDSSSYFVDGLAKILYNNKYSFINTKGELLFNRWFDYVRMFSSGFAVVKLGNGYNFIDIEGKLLSEQWFDEACPFLYGFAKVKLNGKWNFINKKCEMLSEQWFDSASYFHRDTAQIKLDGMWYIIDSKGNII